MVHRLHSHSSLIIETSVMALELLFTSAVQGLKSGSQGYCTVQCTQAMPGPLAERLEALSAYRPIYPSQSEQAKLNPVNVAYWRIRAVGKTFPVLSRIADYGLDYSQRTNKLAHHLVLEPSELNVAGPAAIAASGAAFVTQWNQKVESIQQPRRLPVAASTVGVCRHWQTVMGDAGWAGVVAEEIIKDQKQPIFLIFEPGQEVLPLIVEVQSLLPAALRWKSTFSTYLTYLPPEAECQIRCLLKGSKEAHESLRHVNSLRIDLTQPKSAPSGPLAEAARTGVMPVQVKKPEAATAFDYESDEEPPALPGHQSFAAEPLQLQVDESGRRPGPRGRRKQYSAAPVLPQKRGMGLYIAGGISVLVLSLVGGVVAMQFLKPGMEKPKGAVENVVQTPVISHPEASVAVVSEPVGSTPASNMVEVQTPISEPKSSVTVDTIPNPYSSTDPIPSSEMASNGKVASGEKMAVSADASSNETDRGKKEGEDGNSGPQIIIAYPVDAAVFPIKENEIRFTDIGGTRVDITNGRNLRMLFSKFNYADDGQSKYLSFDPAKNDIVTSAVSNPDNPFRSTNVFHVEVRDNAVGLTHRNLKGMDNPRIQTLLQSVAVMELGDSTVYLPFFKPKTVTLSCTQSRSKTDAELIDNVQDVWDATVKISWDEVVQSFDVSEMKVRHSKGQDYSLKYDDESKSTWIASETQSAITQYDNTLTNEELIGAARAITWSKEVKELEYYHDATPLSVPKWKIVVTGNRPTISFVTDSTFNDGLQKRITIISSQLQNKAYSVKIAPADPTNVMQQASVENFIEKREDFLAKLDANKKVLEELQAATITVTGAVRYTVHDKVRDKDMTFDFIRFKEPQ
ncbi:GAP1-N2 domain-containing protein [Lacunimicrobium album]